MSRNGTIAVVFALALMSVPTAWTFQEQAAISGHTTYQAMDGLDPCIAGIVGIVRLRVMWFNDQVLFERAAQDGRTHVYAVEHGAPDPRAGTLLPTGEEFVFTDPNGVEWRVVEYVIASGVDASGGDVWARNMTRVPPNPDVGATEPEVEPSGWHVWVVQTGPTVQDFAATGRPYNFVNLVDTCKFQAAGQALTHQRDGDGNWTSTNTTDPTAGHHYPDDPAHEHRGYSVDLYLGEAPRLAAPADPGPYAGGVE